MISTRPRIAELQLHLYARSLHPELFTIYCSKKVQRGDYQATIDVTNAGHLITWVYQNQVLTEAAVASNHPLPEKRRLLSRSMRARHQQSIACRNDVTYEVNFELDTVNPEVFWAFQQELTKSGQQDGIFHQFDSNGRIEMGAMSFITATTRNESLTVQAFHTFPEDHALVKVVSTFRLPSGKEHPERTTSN